MTGTSPDASGLLKIGVRVYCPERQSDHLKDSSESSDAPRSCTSASLLSSPTDSGVPNTLADMGSLQDANDDTPTDCTHSAIESP